MARIIAKPHICKSTLYEVIVPDGILLSEVVSGLDVSSLHIEVNGRPIFAHECNFIKLKEDDLVVIINVPSGKAGQVLGTIAVLASAITGAWLGGWVATSVLGLGAKSLGTYLITGFTSAAFTLGARLLFNALVPPQDLKKDVESPQVKPNITGVRNTYAIWKPIPRLYGTYRYYPPLAARYFTEIAGNDQYLRMLLCLGYGPLEIGGKVASKTSKLTQDSGITEGAIRIGNTDIHSYQDVEYEIGTIDQITLFTANIYEEQVNVNLDCQSTSGEDQWFTDNVSAIRTTDENTKEISLDLVFPSGLYCMNKKGKTRSIGVKFKITITDKINGNVVVEDEFEIWGHRKETYRVNKRYVPSYIGQFDVEVLREATYVEEREVLVSDCVWTVLRSVKEDQPVKDNGKEIIYMALRIRATDQLNGVIDQLNVEATSVLPVYDGSSWNEQATSNPAWIYYHQLTGEHVKHPISEDKILLDDILEWANFCSSLGLEFNYVFDSEQTQFQRLQNIATTGYASFAVKDGYYTVVWDRDTSSDPPVQVISPRNARDFQSTKVFQDLPHALRVRYIDKNTDYAEDEVIVYRSGYDVSNATRYEQIDTLGVTSQEQAWKEGKYHFNQAILRPEKYTVVMDFENLVFTRGDVVLLAYDVIEVGIKWGRIKNITTDENGNVVSIELDETCPMSEGKDYGVQIRKSNGAIVTSQVENPGEGNYTLLNLVTSLTGVSVGDLVLFGELGKEAIRCKVQNIEYNHDLSATVHLVDEAPEVLNFESTPTYNPHITLPLDLWQIQPPAPSVSAFSGTNTLILSGDGTYQPSVVVTWVLPSTARVPMEEIEIRWKPTDDSEDNWFTEVFKYSTGSARIYNVQEGIEIAIQARVKSVYGRYSEWSDPVNHTVAGNSLVPKDVTGFTATWYPEKQIVLFTWDEVTDINLDHFEIREGDNWENGTPVLQNIKGFQASLFIDTIEDTTKTYWIKAISRTGIESTNASSVSVDIYFPKPTSPTSITTESLNYAIKVIVDYEKTVYFDKLEIWASETNDRDSAELVASIEGSEYVLEGLDLVDTRYFWVRIRNIFGRYSDWYPQGQYEGVKGTTDYSADKLLPLLEGSITDDELYQDLKDLIHWTDTETFVLEDDVVESDIIGGMGFNITKTEAEWGVKVNANGHVAGIGLIASSDEPSEMVVVADVFKIVNPSDSNDVKIPFVVGNINGQSTVGIDGDLIVDGSISANAIGADQITGEHIAAGVIDASHLTTSSAVITDSAQIANGIITNAHIEDASITSAKIVDGAIDSAKIADAAITSAKIADAAIQTAHIGEAQIDTLRVANGAITVFSSTRADNRITYQNGGGTLTALSLSIDVPYSGDLVIQAVVQASSDSSGNGAEFFLDVDGNKLFSVKQDLGVEKQVVSLLDCVGVSSGSHTISLKITSGGYYLYVYNRVLVVFLGMR